MRTPGHNSQVQETIQKYCNRLEVLNSVTHTSEMRVMSLVPRSSKESKKIEDSSIPMLNLSMVAKNRDQSQSTERLALTIRSSLEVNNKVMAARTNNPKRKHSEIASKNR